MLRWRLISAAVILAVLLTVGWLDYWLVWFQTPGAWLLPLLLVVSLLATNEVLSLLQGSRYRPVVWTVYFGNLLIPLAACLPILCQLAGRTVPVSPLGAGGWPLVALAFAAMLVIACEMWRFERPGSSILNAALGILMLVYLGLLISFWAPLRLHHDNGWGMAALFSTLLIVKMADTGAFIVGKNLGRTKMTPLLSPGKTWEGAIGGIAVACLTSWAFFHFVAKAFVGSAYVEPPLTSSLLYGACLAVAGMVGDLAESLLKRDMERKDSSTWLPGLGGVMDIIDAVLFAAPVAWLCWVSGLIGPGVGA